MKIPHPLRWIAGRMNERRAPTYCLAWYAALTVLAYGTVTANVIAPSSFATTELDVVTAAFAGGTWLAQTMYWLRRRSADKLTELLPVDISMNTDDDGSMTGVVAYPFHDVVAIDWQTEELGSLIVGESIQRHTGPWVRVDLGQPSETFDETPAWAVMQFAIWKATGNVYAVGADGAVGDDPIFEVTPL